jgi:hypothetical protein
MNNTLFYQQIANPNNNVFIYEPAESLTTWGIFLSSIILSSGSFITSILGQIQKSRCSKINCLGSDCVRDIETF